MRLVKDQRASANTPLYNTGNNRAKIRNYLPAAALIFNDFSLFTDINRPVQIIAMHSHMVFHIKQHTH